MEYVIGYVHAYLIMTCACMYSSIVRPYIVKEPSIGAQRHQLLDRARHLVLGGNVQCRFLFGILCRGKCLARYMYMSGSSALQSPPSSIYTHPTSLPPPPSYSLPSLLPRPPPPLLPTRTPHTTHSHTRLLCDLRVENAGLLRRLHQ